MSEPDWTNTTFTGAPQLVRFWASDRTNLTPGDIERLAKFGYVAIFAEFIPEMVREPGCHCEPTPFRNAKEVV